MTTTNDCGLTVHMVASRNYNIISPDGPILDASGVALRFRSKAEALTEIDAMCADADAGVPAPFDNGRAVEVLVAVRNEFAANPNVGVSALYRALRAAGIKVSKVHMTPAIATVRNELQQAS